MWVVQEGGSGCLFRRWDSQSGVSGSSGAAGAGPWAARSHSTARTLLPPKTPLLDLNSVQISCSSDPATLNCPRVGAQPRYVGRGSLERPISLGDVFFLTYCRRRSDARWQPKRA